MPITINGSTGIAGVDGSAATPALQGTDTNTGISFGSDVIIGSTGGVERWRTTPSGQWLVGTSSVGDYGFAYIGNTSRGDTTVSLLSSNVGNINIHFGDTLSGAGQYSGYISYNHASDYMIIGTATAERMRFLNNGNVCIGRTDTNSGARLNVRSAQTDYTGFAFSVQNGNQSELFAAANDGNIYAGAISTSTGTALVLTSGGYIVKSSSSIRYKENVEPIDIGLDFVMGLSPVKYDLKQSGEAQVGFIAEDFPEPRLVSQSQVDPSDPSKGLQVESVNYQNLVAPLVKAIQEQQAMIAELQAEVAALKAA